jgi:hypothetical protein
MEEAIVTTKLSAVCGCGATLHSCGEIPPGEVVRWAEAHAAERQHTVLFQGEVRVDKQKFAYRRKEIATT